MKRTSEAGRTTGETEITASVNLDGTGRADVSTGNRFVDHMLVSLAECSVDLVRRPHRVVCLSLERSAVEGVPREDIEHFFGSLLSTMEACVHVRVAYGSNDHHRTEAAIKALAVALRAALSPDPRRAGVPSTKGTM